MLRKIQEQNKTIQYLKNKYKEKTGQEMVMPKNWQDYLDVPKDETPLQPLPILDAQHTTKQQNFQLAIDKLNLPTRISQNKQPLTSFAPSNKFHMVESINLSGFKDRGFEKQFFRQFISRIVQMRCLKSVTLSRNGIDDSCAQQIEQFLSIKRITRVDLSRNNIGKNTLLLISKNFQHLQWIDLSRNDFLWDTTALTGLLNAIRTNPRLYHIALDLQQVKHMHTLASYLKIKPHIHSFSPIDSKIDAESMAHICNALQSSSSNKKNDSRLFYLNFSFCYLQSQVFRTFLKSLSLNGTLIYLQLRNNNLGEDLCIQLSHVLQTNLSLTYLGLSSNGLQDNFGKSFAACLSKNQTLQTVQLSKNNIGEIGAQAICLALSQKNDSLQSLGDLSSNGRIGPEILQKIQKALRINKISKQIRASLIQEDHDLSAVQISNRQTQAFLESQYKDFELLVPLAISNPIRQQPNILNLWKFD